MDPDERVQALSLAGNGGCGEIGENEKSLLVYCKEDKKRGVISSRKLLMGIIAVGRPGEVQ